MQAAKRISLDDLLDTGKKVYVRNTARKANLLMVIQMKDKHGNNHDLKIPPIRFPVCISEQFSVEAIRESTDLKKALQKKVLELVEPTQAEKELSSQEAAEEMKAFDMSVYSDAAPGNAVRDSVEKLKAQSNPEAAVNATELLKAKTLDDAVDNRVKGIISSFHSKEKSSKDTLVALRRMKEFLTEADLTYIISQCRNETTLREFAENTLSEKSAAPEAPFAE